MASVTIEVRREHEGALMERYLKALGSHGWNLDADIAGNQYRLFSVYSWIAAVSTAAMGEQWQPVEVTRPALLSTTGAIEDLEVLDLLRARL